VLQVHSLERPKDINTRFELCDSKAARRAVDLAGKVGVPFRVALPTYGYLIAFDSEGKYLGLSGRGIPGGKCCSTRETARIWKMAGLSPLVTNGVGAAGYHMVSAEVAGIF